MKKRCSKCRQSQPSSAFSKQAGRKDGLHSICKKCRAIYHKEYYQLQNNGAKRAAYNRRRRKGGLGFQKQMERLAARRADMQKWFAAIKAELECVRCGEDHPACLDFHHRDPSKKDKAISRCIIEGWSKPRVLAEIAKCDALCANCHRKLHALDADRNGTGVSTAGNVGSSPTEGAV